MYKLSGQDVLTQSDRTCVEMFVLQDERNHFPAGAGCPSELLPGSGIHISTFHVFWKHRLLLLANLNGAVEPADVLPCAPVRDRG